jgi:dimethylargininase
MFKHVLVRTPGKTLTRGITSHPELGAPDYEGALAQHRAYIRAMESLGAAVTVLPPLEEYPDSCFVEDVAVLSEKWAVITNPGAPSRKGEIEGIIPAIRQFYPEDRIHRIADPGALEGGDVMRVEDTFYVGLSSRTNHEGIRRFQEILEPYGCRVVPVPLREVLHLKTGVNYLSGRRILVSGEFTGRPEFAGFEKIPVPPEEDYAANCVWMNGSVLVPAGFPQIEGALRALGYPVLPVDTSEYRKIDGGLSCLSLRF